MANDSAKQAYTPLFPLGADDTVYEKLTGDHVSLGEFEGQDILKVAPRAGQKADVLLALDRLAYGRPRPLTHPGSCPPKRRRRSRSLAAPRPFDPRLF